MKKFLPALFILAAAMLAAACTTPTDAFPRVTDTPQTGYFPLMDGAAAAPILTDPEDFSVVGIAARMNRYLIGSKKAYRNSFKKYSFKKYFADF